MLFRFQNGSSWMSLLCALLVTFIGGCREEQSESSKRSSRETERTPATRRQTSVRQRVRPVAQSSTRYQRVRPVLDLSRTSPPLEAGDVNSTESLLAQQETAVTIATPTPTPGREAWAAVTPPADARAGIGALHGELNAFEVTQGQPVAKEKMYRISMLLEHTQQLAENPRLSPEQRQEILAIIEDIDKRVNMAIIAEDHQESQRALEEARQLAASLHAKLRE